ncbi:hypothetical protein [uncultured Thomasclavelia sp.]|uniref:hypothetical protein n=1 Tax=uncultured Thomasclavelia sp. TaxID=3025759 RepID=UPI00262C6BE0|nr:hypothetical protein [uncultured Thomasclavelia sp.]
MAVEIPGKITIPNIDMSDPADIRQVWDEFQIVAQKINDTIDVLENNDTYLNDAVYHEED